MNRTDLVQLFSVVDAGPARWEVRHDVTDELAALAPAGTDISGCIAQGDYQMWSEANTDAALNGPIPGAEIDSIEGTPTVLVDGAQYPGGLTDSSEFEAFLDSGSGSGQATTQGSSGA